MNCKIQRLVRIIFVLIAITGMYLITIGICWAFEYARGEWMGGLGRWEYFMENWRLSFKAVISTLAGIPVMAFGWLAYLSYPNARRQP